VSAHAAPLTATAGRARRRKAVSRMMEILATLAAVAAIAVLGLVIFGVARRGLPALSWSFLTEVPGSDAFGRPTGGIANSIVGTIIITAIATLIAVPFGVLVAIYTTEFASRRTAQTMRMVLNVLAGVPTIVIGVFMFGLLVVGNGYSAVAGAAALSVVMVPLIARSAEEVLLLVPAQLREGGMALGATRSRTVLTVILPTAVGGIVTATIVAIARAAGETAPLLFTTSIFANAVTTDPRQAMGSIPLTIFFDAENPSPQAQQQAWAAALVLIAIVLLCAIAGRLLSLRTRRQIEKAR
jgi:phosphate transport system permease protein